MEKYNRLVLRLEFFLKFKRIFDPNEADLFGGSFSWGRGSI